MLDDKWWPLNDSLQDYTILQLKSFCQRSEKLDDISHVQASMLLHNNDSP